MRQVAAAVAAAALLVSTAKFDCLRRRGYCYCYCYHDRRFSQKPYLLMKVAVAVAVARGIVDKDKNYVSMVIRRQP